MTIATATRPAGTRAPGFISSRYQTTATTVFRPLGWQIEPWRDKSPIVLLTGSAGGGKSRLAAEKLHGFCLKYPHSTAVALRKTRESLKNSVLLLLERTVIGGQYGVRHFPSYNRFEYPNGSLLAYGGMKNEEQREQIRSIGPDGAIDIVWPEEAHQFVEDDFNEMLARMRGRAAGWNQIILSTNPAGPNHWIRKRLMLGGQAAVYLSRAVDNPHNPDSYLGTLGLLTGTLGKRLRDGLWIQAEGVVYADFDATVPRSGNEDTNLLPHDWVPDPEREVELAYDDGYVDPRAILFIQRTGAEIRVFDEIYHSRHLAETCVSEVVERMLTHFGPKTDEKGKVIDPDIPAILPEIAVGSPEAKEMQARLRMANIPTRKGVHRIVEGIQVVRRLICDGQGYRALKVHPRCTNFISELTEGYVYPETGARRDDETPVDANNHACDGFRYWAWVRARR